MDKIYNLFFAGVGGQGSLLMAEIASLAAALGGFDIKQTEVHGVSQRGGSVETHVRFGGEVFSPVVTPGEADVVVALEKLEALRFAHFVNKEAGTILVNDHEIVPASVEGAAEQYPYDAIPYLEKEGYNLLVLPATIMAHELGDGRMANVIMLGVLSNLLPIPLEAWQKSLHMRLPRKYLKGNLGAFAAGREKFAVTA